MTRGNGQGGGKGTTFSNYKRETGEVAFTSSGKVDAYLYQEVPVWLEQTVLLPDDAAIIDVPRPFVSHLVHSVRQPSADQFIRRDVVM